MGRVRREIKKTWWKESVVYEIYPRSFCDSNGDGIGDLRGIGQKLDYLRDLGVNVLWIAPVYKSPNDDNGYDVADYQDIMTEFGTMEDFDELLAQAHSRGLKIVMDLVVNHTSDEHEWFVESRSSRDNPKRDFYIWRDPVDGHEPTNWGASFGGSAWEWDDKTNQYYLHCFSRKQPDLNWENPAVREEVYSMMRFWLDKGIDGFRMDVINMISKPEVFRDVPTTGRYGDLGSEVIGGPRLHEFLQEMNREVLSRYDMMTVGECGNTGPEEACRLANAEGTELGMIFQFEHVNMDGNGTDKWCHKPMDLPKLKKNLAKWQEKLDGRAWNSLFFNNHDQPRVVSRLGDGSARSAKAIATALYLMQGTPYLYQGEELGMTNYPFKGIEDYHDIESIGAYRTLTEAGGRGIPEILDAIAYKSRDNARTPMQWDDTANAGFTTGTPWMAVNPNYHEINAKRQEQDPDSVLHFYRKLLGLRTRGEDKDLLVYGSFELLLADDPYIWAYRREDEEKEALVVVNLSAKTRLVRLGEESGHFSSYRPVLWTDEARPAAPEMTFAPWEAVVWVRKSEKAPGIRTEAIEAFLDACSRAGLELHRFMLLHHGKCCAKVLWAPYGEDDLHPVYSFSKSLTATAIAFARQEGLLTLDERLVDLFPEDLPEGFETDDSLSARNLRNCAIRHLLSMSCGHEHEIGEYGADWRKAFFAQPFPYEPGTFFLYNTAGSNLLAAIILKKTGQQVTEYLRPRLFAPLGIGADAVSCIRLPDAEGTEHGGGGMSLTLDAMARFTQFMLQDGWWDGRQLLKDWYHSCVGVKQIETEGDSYGHVKEWAKGYSYQSWLGSLPGSFRADGAFGQFGLVYPTLDLCVITNAATEQTQTLIDAVNDYLLPGVMADKGSSDQSGASTAYRAGQEENEGGGAFVRQLQLPGLKNCRNPLFEDMLERSYYKAESGEMDGIMHLVGGAGRIPCPQEGSIRGMEFAFGKDRFTWILTQEGIGGCHDSRTEKKRLEAALDGTFAISELDNIRYAATARWRALRKLEMEIRRLDAMSGVRLILHFTPDGERMTIEADETLMTDGGLGMSERHLSPFVRTSLKEEDSASHNVTGNNPGVVQEEK